MNWIAACKPGSQKNLYDWIETARASKDLAGHHERVRVDGVFYKRQYEYMSDVPIRDSEDAIKTNFVSLIEINERTNKRCQFDYATNLKVNCKNAPGRAIMDYKN